MDFWTKLIGGVSNSKSTSATNISPQQRLQRFRRAYTPILQLCGRPQTLASHGPALDQIHSSLQRVIGLLREESRTPAPHLCLSFAASAQIYSVVARAASASRDQRLVRQAVTLFSLLLETEDEDFVSSAAFARSLMRFALRVIDSSSGIYGHGVEVDVVEILFGVVAKMRIQPSILPVWFTTSKPQDDAVKDKKDKDFAGSTQKDDFPLCYLLIDRIHHDGRIGDFARTGLLYIFEAVSHSTPLEDWIIDSDLPTLMASGLGALYSQLSRELSILHDRDHLPMILALSDYINLPPSSAAENVFSTTHVTHMATFLSHLAFWQDVLEHCKSETVKMTLLDHFRILFLQQLLYPSLLQSSDTDGGSSVAVLTYLSNIFESLDHPELTQMILQYLLAIPEAKQLTPPTPVSNRRKSTLLLMSESQTDDDKFEPNLFSMVDLIMNGVKSRNSQTVVAALKLSSVMLTRHRKYATSTLLHTQPTLSSTEKRTVGALCAETANLIDVAASFGGEYDVDEAYATACQDISASLELQLAVRLQADSTYSTAMHNPRKLLPHDPYMQSIAGLFESFFTNSVDVNLALTEATICLASCADVGLEGWLAIARSDYKAEPVTSSDPTVGMDGLDEEEIANLRMLQSVYSLHSHGEHQDALLPSILRALRHQVDRLRSSFPSIDYSTTKRVAILGGAGQEDPILQTRSSSASDRRSSDIPRPGESARVQRLQAESLGRQGSRETSISRSSTPSRVRQPRVSSLSTVPPRSSSLPKTTQQDQRPHPIFRPPPPDSPDEASVRSAEGVTHTQADSKENEAQTLQRDVKFTRTISSIGGVFEYLSESADASLDGVDIRTVSLSHVVTNLVILQHFVLELAAAMRIRAVIFEEVAFT